jgi:L-serine dehydratase
MKSLSKLFRYGPGPSSSHTIAPAIAGRAFKALAEEQSIDHIRVTLYGSLALTGQGHKTDLAVKEACAPYPVEVVFDATTRVVHPLSLCFEAFHEGEMVLARHYASLGGGEVTSTDDESVCEKDIYPYRNLEEIKTFMAEKKIPTMKEFCLLYEEPSIDAYLLDALKRMFAAIERGLQSEDYLPANDNPRLHWKRCAKGIAQTAEKIADPDAKREMLMSAYAYAAAENSASGAEVVTAPTCGSSGVLPAILYFEYHNLGRKIEDRPRCPLYGGHLWQLGEAERVDRRRDRRLPSRNRDRQQHGGCRPLRTRRAFALSNRIRRRVRDGAFPWPLVRPGRWLCHHSLHRAKWDGSAPGLRRLSLCQVHRAIAEEPSQF